MMGMTPAAITMMRTATPAPTSALITGIRAARSDPRTTSSTMIAMPTPIASMAEMCGMDTENRSPPTWTSPPGMASCRSAPASTSISRWASVRLDGPRPSLARTLMSAAVSSSLISPSTYSKKGDCAISTQSSSSSSGSSSSIACLMAGSVTFCPSGARTTMLAELSAASGNVMRRPSRATWDDAPGMSNSSLKEPPTASARPPRTTRMASQAATTRLRARHEARASR